MPVAYPWGRHALMWLIAGGLVANLYAAEFGWSSALIKLLALGAIATLPFLFRAISPGDVRNEFERLRSGGS